MGHVQMTNCASIIFGTEFVITSIISMYFPLKYLAA